MLFPVKFYKVGIVGDMRSGLACNIQWNFNLFAHIEKKAMSNFFVRVSIAWLISALFRCM